MVKNINPHLYSSSFYIEFRKVLGLYLLRILSSVRIPQYSHYQSNVIYQFKCFFCSEAPKYIGYTERLLRERITEHSKNGSTEVYKHFKECGEDIHQDSFEILYKMNKNKGLIHLKTAEAIFIRSNKPSLNTKDEFQSRKLRMKLF